MRYQVAVSALVLTLVLSSGVAFAQSAPDPSVSIPRLITITGVYRPADGRPPAAVETVTLSVYAEETGGTPLFQETQQVTLDDRGRYSVVLGAAHTDGIPPSVFAAGAQWLGTAFERTGEAEGPRVRLTSVPYALRAAEADTLGGHPASDYQLATGGTSTARTAAGTQSDVTAPAAELPGTPNQIAKYVSTTDVGPAAMYESGTGLVGIGTTTPFDSLHIRFTNTNGGATGLAVQNLGNTNTSYSGMLFYDQNGALGQFQGFNNVTHEYRINNIARNGAAQFDGSINFMGGSVSRFYVAPNGNIGIGTTSPSALLEVSNALPGGPANMWVTSFTNALGPYYLARRARGTPGAPAAVQSGDGLSGLYGMGYGTTQFGPASTGGITIQAAQNFTDTQQGTAITFSTTAINSATPATRMTLFPSGALGLGTTSTTPCCTLEVSNAASPFPTPTVTMTSSYTGTIPLGSFYVGRKARGTAAAPAAVQNGDGLVEFSGQGYGASGFSGGRSGMSVRAAENWTDTAQGTALDFNTTDTGTNTSATRMTITSDGKIGIGTTHPSDTMEIVRDGDTGIVGISYTDNDGGAVLFARARGGIQAPTAVLAGDNLAFFGGTGYGTSSFGDLSGFGLAAAENWTDTARGTAVGFITTPLGSVTPALRAAILPNGNLGLGTPADANGILTAADKLQVFGDVRVGTSGTNGCIKNFAGTGLAGTCVSDRRYKQNITPFRPVLSQLIALQPVHYYWRAAEFPEKHFGDAQAYGLIAQDVEAVLPELVVTNDDGYKAVDYSKLPLLTIQAVKELKAENDAQKAENDALKQRVAELEPLKQRVAELERLLTEMLAASGRR
jgi:endosialidase-like protein